MSSPEYSTTSEDDSMNDASYQTEEELQHEAEAQQTSAGKRQKLSHPHPSESLRGGIGDGIEHAEDAEASLLELEVKELLKDCATSTHQHHLLLDLSHGLSSFIQHLPSEQNVAQSMSASLKRILTTQFDFPYDVRTFDFHPPTSTAVVGSAAFGIVTTTPEITIDLALLISSQCFTNKDQLNHRYHAKRLMFLAHIARHLKAAVADEPSPFGDGFIVDSIEWGLFNGDPRRPVLHVVFVVAAGEDGYFPPTPPQRVVVRLLPAPPRSLCPLHKLSPDRNNLRSVLNHTEEHPVPTPHYNNGILQDMMMSEVGAAVAAAATKTPRLGEASVLLKIWAERQCLSEGSDGIGGFLLTMLLVQLLQSGRASPGMSAIHLFRTTLMALQHPKAFTPFLQLVSVSSSSSSSSPPPSPTVFKKIAGQDVVFLDTSGYLNFAASLSLPSLAQARFAAQQTTTLLSSTSSPDAFDAVFLVRHHIGSLYDSWYHVISNGTGAGGVQDEEGGERSMVLRQYDAPPVVTLERTIEKVATRALGTRATLVRVVRRNYVVPVQVPAQGSGEEEEEEDEREDGKEDESARNSKKKKKEKKKKGKKESNKATLPPPPPLAPANLQRSWSLLAVRLDPTASLRSIDIGPAADAGPPAASFRSFWGPKSELRRFQDGKIAEAVVWEGESGSGGAAQRHTIVDKIVEYILDRHLPSSLSSSSVAILSFSSLLDQPLLRRHHTDNAADIAAVRLCEAAAVRLGKRLRSLDNLTPLKIVGTQSLSPVLRHAALFPPLPHPLAGGPPLSSSTSSSTVPRCLPAIEISCQLEGSGKWPDNPVAYAKMKAAVGVALAQRLASDFGIDASASEEYIDVLTDGFAFRLLLHTERDAAMAHAQIQVHTNPQDDVDVGLRSWHHGIISAIAGQNPAFEPSVRLAKRWIGSQWLSPHFREEVVELLVAVAFASSSTSSSATAAMPSSNGMVAAPSPGSRLSGFLRFLNLLGHHPWTASPLVTGDIIPSAPSGSGTATVTTSFAKKREIAARAYAAQRALSGDGAAPAMFITGPRDDESLPWTLQQPSRPLLHRAAVLARKAARHLENASASASGVAFKQHEGDEHETIEEEGALLGAVFGHDEGEYEVVITLRKEALPGCSGGGHKETALRGPAAPKRLSSLKHTKHRADLTSSLSVEDEKRTRAVLSGIPTSVVHARGAGAVKKELLVGFDPLPLFVSLLEERFGAVAVVCADFNGGASVGLKFKGSALKPWGSLIPEAAHTVKPVSVEEEGEEEGGAGLAVATDFAAVASDCLVLGQGLVERVNYIVTSPP